MPVETNEMGSGAARTPKWIGYVVTVLLEVALTAGLALLHPVFPLAHYPITYILLTMAVAYFFGEGPAILSFVLGWFAFSLFFVPEEVLAWPPDTLDAWAREVAFLLGVLVVGSAMVLIRRSRQRIQRLADEAIALNASLRAEMSEREEAQEALRESEERFRLLIEGVKDYAIFMLDTQGRVLTWNTGAERIYGYSREEIVGQDFSRFFIPEDSAAGLPHEELGLAAEQGQHTVEGWRVCKDGSRFWGIVTTTALRDPNGDLRGYAKIIRDITQRKQADEEIRKLNAELEQRVADRTAQLDLAFKQERAARTEADAAGARVRHFLEMAPDGIIIADQDGAITFVNNQAIEMFGYEKNEMLRAQVEQLIPERYREGHVAHRADYAANPRTRAMGVGLELFGRRKDGTEFPVEIALSPTWSDGELLVTAVIRDITDRKAADQQIKMLNEDLSRRATDLEAANKELEAFSYSVSHDLRAPLRAIDGFSNTLLKLYHDSLDDRGKDYLSRVRAAAGRMAQLIDDILGLSRATRAEMHRQTVDLSELSRDVLDELMRGQPERKADIEISPGMTVDADPHLLRIALGNLLGNAWKFTGNREVARIEVGAFKQNGETVYFVKDNGAGFNPTYAENLFAPFHRLHTETEFPGTGIGLALVQRILRRHGGRVWAEGAEDKGATFFFTLAEAPR